MTVKKQAISYQCDLCLINTDEMSGIKWYSGRIEIVNKESVNRHICNVCLERLVNAGKQMKSGDKIPPNVGPCVRCESLDEMVVEIGLLHEQLGNLKSGEAIIPPVSSAHAYRMYDAADAYLKAEWVKEQGIWWKEERECLPENKAGKEK